MEAWLNKVMLLHLLHFFLHAINFSIDAPLLKLNFCNVLVNVSLLLLTQVIFLTDFPQHLDQFRILLCAISKFFLRFLVRLETILLKLPNLFFAELEVLVELVNQFRVLLLLSHDLFRLFFNVFAVNCHECLQLIGIILILHRLADLLDELLDVVLFLLCVDSGLLPLGLKGLNRICLRLDICLHLLE